MNIKEIPWYCFESLSVLYNYTLAPEFSNDPDSEHILKWMKSCEGIRPEDLNKPIDPSMWGINE